MTAEKLHDALNLLPSDLLAATDQLRTAPRTKIIPWKRLLPAAACFAMLMGMGLLIRHEMPDHIMMKQAAPEAPAAMAPVPERMEITSDAAAPQAPAMDEPMMEAPAEEGHFPEPPSDVSAPEVPYGEAAGSATSREEELFVDHSHSFAEETENAGSTGAYCGNTVTKVYLDGETYSLGGSDSVTLTHILKNLPYNQEAVCRCMAEFTVDTETLTGIQVNLTEAFARCERGQAALTEEQVQTIRTIIENLS